VIIRDPAKRVKVPDISPYEISGTFLTYAALCTYFTAAKLITR